MTGNVNQRLANELERAILIEFLLTELMAAILSEADYLKQVDYFVSISNHYTYRFVNLLLGKLLCIYDMDTIEYDVYYKIYDLLFYTG